MSPYQFSLNGPHLMQCINLNVQHLETGFTATISRDIDSSDYFGLLATTGMLVGVMLLHNVSVIENYLTVRPSVEEHKSLPFEILFA